MKVNQWEKIKSPQQIPVKFIKDIEVTKWYIYII